MAKERNRLLDTRIQEAVGRDVCISIDGRWGSPRQALEGTITCFDSAYEHVLDVQHIGKQMSEIRPATI